jgi:hypothetical protein
VDILIAVGSVVIFGGLVSYYLFSGAMDDPNEAWLREYRARFGDKPPSN